LSAGIVGIQLCFGSIPILLRFRAGSTPVQARFRAGVIRLEAVFGPVDMTQECPICSSGVTFTTLSGFQMSNKLTHTLSILYPYLVYTRSILALYLDTCLRGLPQLSRDSRGADSRQFNQFMTSFLVPTTNFLLNEN